MLIAREPRKGERDGGHPEERSDDDRRPRAAGSGSESQPDELKGEIAKVYVVLLPGAEADSDGIIALCREQLAAYKVPRSVQFVPDLPRTSTGKVMRRELKTLDGELVV